MRVRSAYKTKIKRKQNWKPILWSFLGLIVVGAGIYLFFFAGLFKIKNINAQGSEKVPSVDLSSRTSVYLDRKLFRFIPANNYFLLGGNKLAVILRNEFPAAKEIFVRKIFSSGLVITAVGRSKVMVYCHQEKCFSIDSEGVIFEESPVIYGGLNIVVEDFSIRDFNLGERILEPPILNFITNANEIILKNINLSLLRFEINSNPVADVTAVTSEGWKIILDPLVDVDAQISALRQVLDEKIKDQRLSLDYVDLRIANRIYYKFK